MASDYLVGIIYFVLRYFADIRTAQPTLSAGGEKSNVCSKVSVASVGSVLFDLVMGEGINTNFFCDFNLPLLPLGNDFIPAINNVFATQLPHDFFTEVQAASGSYRSRLFLVSRVTFNSFHALHR